MENISNKQELKNLLKLYKKILNNSTIDYLDSLIELEISAFDGSFDKDVLLNLDLYKKIVVYNICNRVLNILGQNEQILKLDDESKYLSLYTILNDEKIPLFEFGNEKNIFMENPCVGNIELSMVVDGKDLRKMEINRLINKLQKLKKEKNPYEDYLIGVYGTSYSTWEFNHVKEISNCKKMIDSLESRSITFEEEKQIEKINKMHDLLLSELQLKTEDFTEEKEESILKKRLIKKSKLVNVEDNIKYI